MFLLLLQDLALSRMEGAHPHISDLCHGYLYSHTQCFFPFLSSESVWVLSTTLSLFSIEMKTSGKEKRKLRSYPTPLWRNAFVCTHTHAHTHTRLKTSPNIQPCVFHLHLCSPPEYIFSSWWRFPRALCLKYVLYVKFVLSNLSFMSPTVQHVIGTVYWLHTRENQTCVTTEYKIIK